MIIKNNQKLKNIGFKNERQLQSFFEKNLEEILQINFVCTEFSVDKYRIDTVGYDPEKKAFRIIEYKNTMNSSLVDQGYTYLNLLHNRKADFILKYNEVNGVSLKISDIDWSQSRIIFVSTKFSDYQIDATSFKNMPFELWQVDKFDHDIVSIVNKSKKTSVKVNDFVSQASKETLREIIIYDEDYHLENKSKDMIEMYHEVKSKILELGDINIDPRKRYIAFKGATNIIDIEVQQKQLKIHLNMKKGTLKDPENLTIDQSNIGRWGNGDYRIDLKDLDEIEYITYLFKQSYEINK